MNFSRLKDPVERSPYLFFFLFVFFCVFNIASYGLTDWDELIYAEASRQMLLRGNYLNIFINEQPFAEKPPFFFWIMTLSYRIFGINETGARMPSVLAGALLFIVLYRTGAKMHSQRFGLCWAVIVSFALFPSLLARSAVIDGTFNMFIAFSCIGFFFFEKALIAGNRSEQWKILTLVSLTMGLGVLSKGPLGGAVPVFCYGLYKVFNRKPMFGPAQFFYCGALSLSVAGIWVLLNWVQYGERFLLNFWEFQASLFSSSLDGHTGPFYFHFVAVALGFLPWTPLLLFFPFREFARKEHPLRSFFWMGCAWVLLILLIMSLVQTKLPHYSSSVYVPLGFAAAFSMERFFSGGKARWKIWKYVAFAFALLIPVALQLSLPSLLDYVSSGLQYPALQFDKTAYYVLGAFGLLLVVFGFFFFCRKNLRYALLGICLSLVFIWNSLYGQILPAYFNLTQRPLIEQIEKYKTEGDIVFYKFLFFTPFFYNQVGVNVIGHYKFKGNPEALSQPSENNQYIFTSLSRQKKLEKKYPNLEKIFKNNFFLIYLKTGSAN